MRRAGDWPALRYDRSSLAAGRAVLSVWVGPSVWSAEDGVAAVSMTQNASIPLTSRTATMGASTIEAPTGTVRAAANVVNKVTVPAVAAVWMLRRSSPSPPHKDLRTSWA